MEKKSVKFELESSRKVYLSLGLFIVSTSILMAFTYKVPVYLIEKEIVEQKIDIPIILMERDFKVPEVLELPEVKPKTAEASTPILSNNLLNNVEPTKSLDDDPQLVVSTPDPVDLSTLNFSPTLSDAPDLNVVVEYPDYDAQFIGSWTGYLGQNLVYPYESVRSREAGEVYLAFVVEIDGTVTDIEVLNKEAPRRLQREAIRVVEKSPKWKPGSVKGEYVRSKKIVKVNFVLGD